MWLILFRVFIIALLAHAGYVYSPFPGQPSLGVGLGVVAALAVIALEMKLRAVPGHHMIGALIGDVYTLGMEDAFTPLRDAREFATLLNSCGRMGKPGLGLSICVGDRGESLRESMKLLSEYRAEINRSVQGILSDSGRVEIREDFAFVTGDDLVDEKLLGPVTSILASAPQFKGRVIVARTKSGDSELKISSRVGDSHDGEVNLGVMMREAAEKMGGVGGGHMMAAGAKIPLSRGPEFAKTLVERAGV